MQNKHHDQIRFIVPDVNDAIRICRAGIIDFLGHGYRKADDPAYVDAMGPGYTCSKDSTKRVAAHRSSYYEHRQRL